MGPRIANYFAESNSNINSMSKNSSMLTLIHLMYI